MIDFLKGLIRIFGVIRDIRNYLFLRRVTKRELMNSPIWAKNNLRVDWIGRIYTVMNLPPEVTMAPDLPRELWPAYLIEQSKGLNEYLTSLNLHEIIIPEYREIPESNSYLLVYSPYFRDLTKWWIVSRTIFWTTAIIIESKTQWLSQAWAWTISLF
jgi:hypothetical protein